MARLHDIDGVTRVSLSKSAAKIVEERGRSEQPSAERRNAMPCGMGKRPAFEIVMFFEKDAAAVATTPTTRAAAAGATPTPTPTPDRRRRSADHRPRPPPTPQGGATP